MDRQIKETAELKKAASDEIDNNREAIIGIGKSIFNEPEEGYREFRTAEKVFRMHSAGFPFLTAADML